MNWICKIINWKSKDTAGWRKTIIWRMVMALVNVCGSEWCGEPVLETWSWWETTVPFFLMVFSPSQQFSWRPGRSVGQRRRMPGLGRRHSLVNDVSWAGKKEKNIRELIPLTSDSPVPGSWGAETPSRGSHVRHVVQVCDSAAFIHQNGGVGLCPKWQEKNLLCLACVIRSPPSFLLHLKWEPCGAK